MTEPVKRYVVRGNTEDGKGPGFVGEVVLAYVHDAEVARLEQECEQLLDLLADWSSHFTGPKVIGGPLSSLRERTDAVLLNSGRS